MSAVIEISARDAHQRWSAAPDKTTLLDVREAKELLLCSIPGAKHIPMNDVPARLKELNQQHEIIVFCHHGRRGFNVASFLLQQGFPNVKNMTGGIESWSTDVDPKTPRY